MAEHNYRFTDAEIEQMQKLKEIRVPMSHIAKHFSTTTPTIKYHTNMILPWSISEILGAIDLKEEAVA